MNMRDVSEIKRKKIEIREYTSNNSIKINVSSCMLDKIFKF